jgi:pseudaminic acid synthase
MKEFKIADRKIGKDNPVFIIAEMSCNHLQKYEYAERIVHEAAKAGADAIKIQTYTADTMTIDCDNEYFQLKGTIWEGKNLYQLYEEAYTPWEWQPKLQKLAEELGLIFFSTPFDKTSVDFLEELNVPAYKLASYEIQDIPLIKCIAEKKKPVIFSTGMARLSDIELALDTFRENGTDEIAMLKCVSAYPTPIEDMNLRTIQNMDQTFDVIPGLSDHTMGITVPVVSVALGAKIIEKHITLDRSYGGPDAPFSLEPEEFRGMVAAVRDAEKAIGKVTYELNEKQKRSKALGRSIFVVEDMKEGEIFTEENIRVIRPGQGMEPKYYESVLGKKARMNIKKGTPLANELIF